MINIYKLSFLAQRSIAFIAIFFQMLILAELNNISTFERTTGLFMLFFIYKLASFFTEKGWNGIIEN